MGCTGGGFVRYYNATNGGVARNFPSMSDFVYAVDVSPDGQIVVAGGQEGTIRVYNGANGQLLRTLESPDAAKKTAKKS